MFKMTIKIILPEDFTNSKEGNVRLDPSFK